MNLKSLKSLWKKVWYFIWEDDSIWSWLVNILIAFILIKFIIYPGLGFALQTSHPIVAVVSGSMEHKMTPYGDSYRICQYTFDEKEYVGFEKFWEICGPLYQTEFGISEEQFRKFPLKNGFNKGDIMVLYSAKNIEVGDVIVYQGSQFPIIHRVVQVDKSGTVHTAGDHNGYKDPAVSRDQIIGKAVFKIPLLGYIKIIAVKSICIFSSNFTFCTI